MANSCLCTFNSIRYTSIVPLNFHTDPSKPMKLLTNNLFFSAILFILCGLSSTAAVSAETTTPDATAPAEATTTENPRVKLTTNMGDLVIELYPQKAPLSVENFVTYVNDGFYTNTIFHRVIDGFMIQGGGFTLSLDKKDTRDPIQNEADNQLPNVKYSIAMARTQAPHSATAQFFINAADNDFLNHRSKNIAGWGYTVFGQVIEGQDITDQMSKVATGSAGRFNKDVPVDPIVIEDAVVLPAK